MILVAGLTPAWQTIMRLDELRTGEVNRAREVYHFASGKVLNVAVGLGSLGQGTSGENCAGPACTLLSPLGSEVMLAAERELRPLNIDAHWIATDAPTRNCITLLDAARGVTTELVENALPLRPEELTEFERRYHRLVVSAQVIVLTGSLPAQVPADFYARLLAEGSCPAILDARGPELRAALQHRPWLVKPNREELGTTLGRPLADDRAVVDAMHELCSLGAQRVLVTAGADCAWFLDGSTMYRLRPPKINPVVNPIGSGDSLSSGIARKLADGAEPLNCVLYGMAAAAENVRHLLPARFTPQGVEEHLSAIEVERYC